MSLSNGVTVREAEQWLTAATTGNECTGISSTTLTYAKFIL